ncbi:T9SS type A sorting domain-containing protein, partial [Nostoc sp. CHAB 5834]|nr:T9SS type A sorting domain-containing protein [Nostoc sp. CHAB 5834]
NTASASINVYYVTQTDNFNCESANDTVVVRVSAKSTARLSGDGNIYQGDSTAIRIRFTGDGPWSFIDWNNKLITVTDSLYVRWEKPSSTSVYAIRALTSSCGAGDILNNYTLTVLVPLATQPTPEPLFLNAYPNPSTGDLNVDWRSPKRQTITLQLINAEGKVIDQVIRQAAAGAQTEHFRISGQPAGTYILNVITTDNGKLTRRIVKQ